MKWYIALLFPVLLVEGAAAQQQDSFDLATYSVPVDWEREQGANTVTYSQVSADNISWCQLTIFPSVASKGTVSNDFSSEWDQIVAQQHTLEAGPQIDQIRQQDGWEYLSGSGQSSYNGAEIQIRLVTFSDENQCVSILARTNNTAYWQVVDDFLASLELKPSGTGENTQYPLQQTGISSSQFAYTVSNFDDGWVSSVMNDYVLVQKGGVKVYLNFSQPYNASQFSGTGLTARDHYWDTEVPKLFQVESKQYNDGGSMVMKPPYIEGQAKDLQTGESCFIGMYLLISTNAVNLVIASAPSEALFRAVFPAANDAFTSDLAGMTRYNKFAVAPGDLVGKWQNGNTETAQWYYVSPAGHEGYAGMTVAATSATFQFNAGNTYSSIHNGATGAVGNMNTFQQEYKGNYMVNDWSVTATNRFGGNTDVFYAYFIAVRGGRILKLNNSAGQDYSLLRVK